MLHREKRLDLAGGQWRQVAGCAVLLHVFREVHRRKDLADRRVGQGEPDGALSQGSGVAVKEFKQARGAGNKLVGAIEGGIALLEERVLARHQKVSLTGKQALVQGAAQLQARVLLAGDREQLSLRFLDQKIE